MKKIAVILMIVLFCTTTFSQNNKPHMSGFGGPLFQFSSLKSTMIVTTGGGGGAIYNSFYFGGFGEGIASEVKPLSEDYGNHSFSFGHGGMWFGYNFQLSSHNFLFVHSQIGWGSATLIKDGAVSYMDEYMLVKPAVEFERKVIDFLKIGVGVSYPIFSGIQNPMYSDNDLSQPNAFISFKFGWFQYY